MRHGTAICSALAERACAAGRLPNMPAHHGPETDTERARPRAGRQSAGRQTSAAAVARGPCPPSLRESDPNLYLPPVDDKAPPPAIVHPQRTAQPARAARRATHSPQRPSLSPDSSPQYAGGPRAQRPICYGLPTAAAVPPQRRRGAVKRAPSLDAARVASKSPPGDERPPFPGWHPNLATPASTKQSARAAISNIRESINNKMSRRKQARPEVVVPAPAAAVPEGEEPGVEPGTPGMSRRLSEGDFNALANMSPSLRAVLERSATGRAGASPPRKAAAADLAGAQFGAYEPTDSTLSSPERKRTGRVTTAVTTRPRTRWSSTEAKYAQQSPDRAAGAAPRADEARATPLQHPHTKVCAAPEQYYAAATGEYDSSGSAGPKPSPYFAVDSAGLDSASAASSHVRGSADQTLASLSASVRERLAAVTRNSASGESIAAAGRYTRLDVPTSRGAAPSSQGDTRAAASGATESVVTARMSRLGGALKPRFPLLNADDAPLVLQTSRESVSLSGAASYVSEATSSRGRNACAMQRSADNYVLAAAVASGTADEVPSWRSSELRALREAAEESAQIPSARGDGSSNPGTSHAGGSGAARSALLAKQQTSLEGVPAVVQEDVALVLELQCAPPSHSWASAHINAKLCPTTLSDSKQPGVIGQRV